MMIEAKGIRKTFGSLEVLKGVDISVRKGEMVAVTGASGAGKTTLLQILGTLSTPTGGSLLIDGTPVFSLSGDDLSDFRCRKIGFVFQFHHLLPEFTALENVMLPSLIAGKSRKQAKTQAEELLSEVGLSERMSHKPAELSGGEQQRVAIARALANRPAVIFADEPTGNLDSVTKKEINALLLSVREKFGQTVVIVTHDADLASVCDRTLTMSDGLFV